jgi:MOSC domain-containing protein YiiM
MKPQTSAEATGVVRGIAYRASDGDPMIETTQCRVLPGRGLEKENRRPGRREVTLLSVSAWVEACTQLRAVIPWHARRANLLVEGLDLRATLGRTLTIGEARIKVHEESEPCGLLDEQYPGLQRALEPDCRSGVAGQILDGGIVRIGDRVTVVPP